MDHLERPSNPQDVNWPIPLLCKGTTSGYTLETFFNYPKNHVSTIPPLIVEDPGFYPFDVNKSIVSAYHAS